jgi:TonB family protein
MSHGQDKRLPIAALALGIVGLFTGGLLGVGSVVGLALAVAGLSRARRDPQRYGGRDLAWVAIVANGLALLSLPLLLALGLALRPMLARDNSLPAPMPEGSSPAAEEAPLPTAPPTPPSPPPPSLVLEGVPNAEVRAMRAAGRVVEPRKLHDVPPVYPEAAKQARVQGVVILECTISNEGRVTDVRVLRGVPLLDVAAVDAVKQWSYTPARLDGKPVPVIMTVTVNFRLN